MFALFLKALAAEEVKEKEAEKQVAEAEKEGQYIITVLLLSPNRDTFLFIILFNCILFLFYLKVSSQLQSKFCPKIEKNNCILFKRSVHNYSASATFVPK